jgi:hypothetical protein
MEADKVAAYYADAAKKLHEKKDSKFGYGLETLACLCDALELKATLGVELRAAYKAGDKAALKSFADVELPDLKARMRELRRVHMENWFDLYKPLGWDIMDMRYGSLFTRIDSAIEEINMYLDGKLETIEELDQERLYYSGVDGSIKYLNYFGDIVSPSRIAPKA